MKKTAVLASAVVAALSLASCRKEETFIRAPGLVEGKVVTIRTQAVGVLDAWTAAEGLRLVSGQEIGRLNQDKILNALEEVALTEKEVSNQEARLKPKLVSLRANVDYLKGQVERVERLVKESAAASDELDRANLRFLEAEAGLFEAQKALAALGIQKDKLAVKRRALDLQLKDTVLISPVDGPVLDTYVTVGETLLPGAVLADVLDERSLYIGVFLEEKELGRLKRGGRADILIDGRSGPPLRGTIFFFGRQAEFSPKYILSEKEREALLYEVRVTPENPGEVLKIGMPVTVVFRPE
ncbi:MAG: HlyD family efflux transporter periplasmic adaptor subunit [Candidatus Aminicenantes bacterium]|nr:HlyD family efflux transporter periplasmic adaptor subunit [Candidatus Aminicenantes bacterium]